MTKIAISGKSFERWFKKTVTHPLLTRIDAALADAKEHAVDDVMRDALDAIHHELPGELYAWITTAEANFSLPGSQKYIGVVNQLANWLMSRGYGWAVPLLVPTVESSVRRVYKAAHVESIFDKLHIEDNCETWLGFQISTNNDDDDARDAPVPAPTRTTAKVAAGTSEPTSTGTGSGGTAAKKAGT